jgi:membrane protein DedA with SNARE-associated domain
VNEVLEWLRQSPPYWGLAAIGGASAAEYLLPMLPGDSVLLVGALWIVAGQDPFWLVWAVSTAGGVAGAWIQYEIGLALRRPDGTWRGGRRVRRWLDRGSVDRFFALYRRFGPGLLFLNRALPGVRGVVFLAAGAGRLPRGPSLLAGGVSQAAWSAGVLGLGVWVGDNWEKIQATFQVYNQIVYALAGILAAAWIGFKLWRARNKPPSSSSSS